MIYATNISIFQLFATEWLIKKLLKEKGITGITFSTSTPGPYLGIMYQGDCLIMLHGNQIVCRETKKGFVISEGIPDPIIQLFFDEIIGALKDLPTPVDSF